MTPAPYGPDDYDDYPGPDSADEAALGESSQFPSDMRLTLSIGLTEYAPNGLLSLIAERLIATVGRVDKWKERFRALLTRLGHEKINALLDAEVAMLLAERKDDIRAQLEIAVHDYLDAAVDSRGEPIGSSDSGFRRVQADAVLKRAGKPSRLEYQTRKLAEQIVKESFAEFADSHRERMKSDLKAILTELMAARLAKSLPEPEILK